MQASYEYFIWSEMRWRSYSTGQDAPQFTRSPMRMGRIRPPQYDPLKMKVPFNDLQRAANLEAVALDQAMQRVRASGWFVMGQEVAAFEKEFAAWNGNAHCISVANGSDALALALIAAGVGRDDLVATAANAAMYSSLAIHALGARPVFLDIDPKTNGVAVDTFAAIASPAIKALIVTHLYGQLAAIKELVALAKRFDIAVIEDCAQAHGAQLDGYKAGTFGALATFSFYPTKNLGALGDGGAVLTSDDLLAKKLRALRQYGWERKYQVTVEGGRNSRLDEIQAAVLRTRLPGLDADNARRLQIAKRYSAGIKHPLVRTPAILDESFVAHLYVIRTAQRASLQAHLANHGIGCDVHYPIPDHRQALWSGIFDHIQLPQTESAAEEVLSLPCFPQLSDPEIDLVIDIINNWNA
jgi:dTDP-3-amino-2,3,6-trideoxy-4-keto-D-glucose/dTDP-3-amino-3,4,6-trideoxy-alpha-D-glucose/dTDP-2,6-dideoxy-D-kanosamine transaminase